MLSQAVAAMVCVVGQAVNKCGGSSTCCELQIMHFGESKSWRYCTFLACACCLASRTLSAYDISFHWALAMLCFDFLCFNLAFCFFFCF